MNVVVKVGTSSITDDDGHIDRAAIAKVCGEICEVREAGHQVVLVSSGAIAAGLPALGLTARKRPRDARTLQAVSAVGQARLMATYNECFAELGDTVAGQVLLVPDDLNKRSTYLQARATLDRLVELGVVPIINENDAIADDEIRIGDNDRIAALVAQLVQADVLVLLTDAAGLLTADPRVDRDASLIEDVLSVDHELEQLAGGSSSNRGSGGMATKLAAAKIAAWSGVRTVIAAAGRPSVLPDAIDSVPGVGTIVWPAPRRLPARKVWIAFAVGAKGRVHVDAGAKAAVLADKSLLAPGIRSVDGTFGRSDAVEIVGPDGEVFGKGAVRIDSSRLVGGEQRGVAIHKDDLVVLS
ncbi:MAG: glutamate 5-kinase [Acidimicrobiales bacterium]